MKRFNKIIVSSAAIIITVFLCPPSPPHSEEDLLWPVELPKSLTGTLGEKRGWSFHNGIDIKTNGRNGYPVHAIASGLLYRIVSREHGYGNAIHIKHGSNRYSFYAHLQKFEDIRFGLNSLIPLLKILYNTDMIDFRFYDSRNHFNRGEVIGFTGESGSGFPHLHFELREKGGTTNPMKLISIPDKTEPVIENIFLCVERNRSTIYEKRIQIHERGGRLRPEEDPIGIDIGGTLFFKVSCYDRVGAENKVAVYRIKLLEGEKEIYDIKFDHLRWRDARFGSLIYDISKSTIEGQLTYTYFLCKREGNNFSGLGNNSNGYILLPKGKKKFKLLVQDYAGNSAVADFSVLRTQSYPKDANGFIQIKRGSRYTISNKSREITLRYKSNTLNNDTLIRVSEVNPEGITRYLHEKFSITRDDILKLYSIFPHDIVYRYPLTISISRPLKTTPTEARGILIYHFFEGGYPKPLMTKYSARDDRFIACTRTNGFFALIRDTKPPTISLPPTHEFVQDIKIYRRLRFYTRDNLSGIQLQSINCYIDGELYPFSFDSDRKWIEFELSRNAISEGLHHVLIQCTDYSNNYGEFRGIFGF
jgi:hypothetical protein